MPCSNARGEPLVFVTTCGLRRTALWLAHQNWPRLFDRQIPCCRPCSIFHGDRGRERVRLMAPSRLADRVPRLAATFAAARAQGLPASAPSPSCTVTATPRTKRGRSPLAAEAGSPRSRSATGQLADEKLSAAATRPWSTPIFADPAPLYRPDRQRFAGDMTGKLLFMQSSAA